MTDPTPRRLHDAAWPDLFENLQTAYGELSRAQFELERRTGEIDEARGLFERVIQSMSEALFLLDTSGRVVQANRAASELLGLPGDVILGRTLSDVCGNDTLPNTPWQLLAANPDGTLRNLDIDLRLSSGGAVTVSVSCSLARDHRGKVTGVLAVVRDITERKRAESALRFLAQASQVLAGSLDVTTVMRELAHVIVPAIADWCSIDVIDEAGRIEHVADAHIDPAAEPLIAELRQRFPLPAEAGLGYAQVMKTASPVLVPQVREEHLTGISVDPEYRRLIARLGLTSHLCVPMLSRARLIGTITLNFTGAQRRYAAADVAVAEDLSRRAAAALDNARLYQSAQEANRMKDEFLATLSHELRTPLNAILGWVKVLRLQPSNNPQLDRALEVIDRNAAAQRQLIEDLLDLSGIVAGKVRFEPKPVDVGRVIETAVDGLRLAAETRQITIRLRPPETQARVAGDADRLQQVVWNLLSNAIKFTPAHGHIDVSLTTAGPHLEIAVADTGRGIRREFLPHVFDRFRQQDSSTTRSYGGLGLGLAIVKNLVEMHGGHVSVESEGEGKGARFIVRLPIMLTAAAPVRQPAEANAAAALDLNGIRVLVVEDDQDSNDLLRLLLQRWGATVASATSVNAAMAHLALDRPDLIITDIGLPGEDGYSLLRRVRALPGERGGLVPALVVSAYAHAEERRRAEAAGFQHYLTKPFDPSALAAAIAATVNRDGRDR